MRIYRSVQYLVAEWEKAVRVRAASTDLVIDHILYSVYGLTEDQVAIVGQSVNR